MKDVRDGCMVAISASFNDGGTGQSASFLDSSEHPMQFINVLLACFVGCEDSREKALDMWISVYDKNGKCVDQYTLNKVITGKEVSKL